MGNRQLTVMFEKFQHHNDRKIKMRPYGRNSSKFRYMTHPYWSGPWTPRNSKKRRRKSMKAEQRRENTGFVY